MTCEAKREKRRSHWCAKVPNLQEEVIHLSTRGELRREVAQLEELPTVTLTSASSTSSIRSVEQQQMPSMRRVPTGRGVFSLQQLLESLTSRSWQGKGQQGICWTRTKINCRHTIKRWAIHTQGASLPPELTIGRGRRSQLHLITSEEEGQRRSPRVIRSLLPSKRQNPSSVGIKD